MNLLLELLAGMLTAAGIYCGTTVWLGWSLYAASQLFWNWLIWRRRMWGLVPLQIIMAAVIVANLAKLWSAP